MWESLTFNSKFKSYLFSVTEQMPWRKARRMHAAEFYVSYSPSHKQLLSEMLMLNCICSECVSINARQHCCFTHLNTSPEVVVSNRCCISFQISNPQAAPVYFLSVLVNLIGFCCWAVKMGNEVYWLCIDCPQTQIQNSAVMPKPDHEMGFHDACQTIERSWKADYIEAAELAWCFMDVRMTIEQRQCSW